MVLPTWCYLVSLLYTCDGLLIYFFYILCCGAKRRSYVQCRVLWFEEKLVPLLLSRGELKLACVACVVLYCVCCVSVVCFSGAKLWCVASEFGVRVFMCCTG